MAAHYFDKEPAVTSAPASVEVNLADMSLQFRTDRGVFSAHRLDPGTKLLLNEVPLLPQHSATLDLGCGWGAIACVTALRTITGRIWAIDTNARARHLTALNAHNLGVQARLTVAAPDQVHPNVRFDHILSNPPIRIGKPALRSCLAMWLNRLSATGIAHLVMQKHLGSDSMQHWLSEQGFPTSRLVSRSGYRILEVHPTQDGRVRDAT